MTMTVDPHPIPVTKRNYRDDAPSAPKFEMKALWKSSALMTMVTISCLTQLTEHEYISKLTMGISLALVFTFVCSKLASLYHMLYLITTLSTDPSTSLMRSIRHCS